MTTPRELAEAVELGMLRAGTHSRGPWSNNPRWGNLLAQAWPASLANGQGLFSVLQNGEFPGAPQVRTVSLFRAGLDLTPPAGVNCDIRARITYGLGGASSTFKVDWVTGVQLALLADTIRVDAEVFAPDSTAAYNTVGANPINAAVMVGEGAYGGSNGLPTLTSSFGVVSLPAAGTTGEAVPPFARQMTLHIPGNNNPATAQTVLIRFRQSQAGSILAEYDAQVCAGGRYIPVPAGTKAMTVTNNTAGAVRMLWQWGLAL